MERQLKLFAKQTVRAVRTRPAIIFPLLFILVPSLYFLFGISQRTFSSDLPKEDRLIDIYEDGVWYQVNGEELDDNSRQYTDKNVKITVDNDVLEISTKSIEVQSVLTEAGVRLGEFDRAEPHLFAPIYDGMLITVVRVSRVQEQAEEIIPNGIEYLENSQLLIGTENVLKEGRDGLKILTIEKEFEDGILISKKIIDERIVEYPVNQLIEKGTKIEILDTQEGAASYYVHPKYAGELITAHNTYPIGSKVRVTNIQNGKSVIVTVVDRGIHSSNRVVDLSKAAFAQIEDLWKGLAYVRVELVKS